MDTLQTFICTVRFTTSYTSRTAEDFSTAIGTEVMWALPLTAHRFSWKVTRKISTAVTLPKLLEAAVKIVFYLNISRKKRYCFFPGFDYKYKGTFSKRYFTEVSVLCLWLTSVKLARAADSWFPQFSLVDLHTPVTKSPWTGVPQRMHGSAERRFWEHISLHFWHLFWISTQSEYSCCYVAAK